MIDMIAIAAINTLFVYNHPNIGKLKIAWSNNCPRNDDWRYVGNAKIVNWVVATEDNIIILTLNKNEFK